MRVRKGPIAAVAMAVITFGVLAFISLFASCFNATRGGLFQPIDDPGEPLSRGPR